MAAESGCCECLPHAAKDADYTPKVIFFMGHKFLCPYLPYNVFRMAKRTEMLATLDTEVDLSVSRNHLGPSNSMVCPRLLQNGLQKPLLARNQ